MLPSYITKCNFRDNVVHFSGQKYAVFNDKLSRWNMTWVSAKRRWKYIQMQSIRSTVNRNNWNNSTYFQSILDIVSCIFLWKFPPQSLKPWWNISLLVVKLYYYTVSSFVIFSNLTTIYFSHSEKLIFRF